MELNVLNQDLSANSEVLDVSSKRRKVHDGADNWSEKGDDELLSINLTGLMARPARSNESLQLELPGVGTWDSPG